ncbi:MAG: sugar ABC transporter ATP-binding protein [Geminicoccaceae bacterium]
MSEPVLRVDGLSKRYPGVQALEDVSLEIRAREVVGLVGENGAGKSTLLKVLAGLVRGDSGSITVRGRELEQGSYRAAAAMGIGMVFQEQSLLPNLRVAENILLGHEGDAVRLGVYDWRRMSALAERQLTKLGVAISPMAITESLSFAERQLVEFAKALTLEERTRHEPVILLDEPTSILESGEIDLILGEVERLRTRASVVFVSHRLDEVLRVSDRVYVMTNGRCVAERDPGDCDTAELQRLMLGRDLAIQYQQKRSAKVSPAAAIRLEARDLSLAGAFRDVGFALRAGEVLGVAGVEGSGREMLCRTLFGAAKPTGGQILLDGGPVTFASPADAVRHGVGYLPAERRTEGIIGGLSVKENITLAHADVIQRGPFLDLRREEGLARRWIGRLRIKTPSPDTPAANLSGGNQQKVVLAKWLVGNDTRILILDHPMRGLDVGAKAEIFELIKELAQSGIGIVLIADTLDELIALSDTFLVMRDGQISGRFDAAADGPTRLDLLERMV